MSIAIPVVYGRSRLRDSSVSVNFVGTLRLLRVIPALTDKTQHGNGKTTFAIAFGARCRCSCWQVEAALRKLFRVTGKPEIISTCIG